MKVHRPFQSKVIQEVWPEREDRSQLPTELLPVISLTTDQPSSLALPLPVMPPPADEAIIAQHSWDTDIAETAFQENRDITIAETTRLPRGKFARGIALTLCLLLATTLYFAWHTTAPAPASPPVTQPMSGTDSNSPDTNANATNQNTTAETIQVYVLGAVLHPGVYTLPADSRVYQLLQAAGGSLPHADLVSLNLAAKLTDGQEVYVLTAGQTLPTSLNNSTSGSSSPSTTSTDPGQLVNINTAAESEMEQKLHVSATTAKKIIDYRTQHGLYTSTAQLLQAISQAIYDRIKDMVTI